MLRLKIMRPDLKGAAEFKCRSLCRLFRLVLFDLLIGPVDHAGQPLDLIGDTTNLLLKTFDQTVTIVAARSTGATATRATHATAARATHATATRATHATAARATHATATTTDAARATTWATIRITTTSEIQFFL